MTSPSNDEVIHKLPTFVDNSPAGQPRDRIQITFLAPNITALRLVALKTRSHQDISWYLHQLITEAYIRFVEENQEEP